MRQFDPLQGVLEREGAISRVADDIMRGAFERRDSGRRSGLRGGSGGVPRETPLAISGLKAWWDARTDAYFTFSTGAQISAWLSRAGSMGAVSFTQATSANQPVRATSVASFNNKNTVQFDGTNDEFQADNAASAWKFLHDGSGASVFFVRRIDSTGDATQFCYATADGASQVGVNLIFISPNDGQYAVADGDGTYANAAGHANQGVRDTSAWQAITYTTGTRVMHVSGLSDSNADTSAPSSADATRALVLGGPFAAGNNFKGHIACFLVYDRVLAAGERSQLAAWAAVQYGVAA